MKIFILCGGFGSRLDNEGKLKAKPMVKIGGKPILVHLLETFVKQGFRDFVILTGYKSTTITSYFLDQSKKKINLKKNKNFNLSYKLLNAKCNIDFIYTGIKTGTGGRIKIAFNKLKIDEDIFVTYGDGLANLKIKKLVKFHYDKKSMMTMTAVRPKERYGILKLNNDTNVVQNLDERKQKSNILINGGYFIISKKFISLIKSNKDYFEQNPLKKMIRKRKLYAFRHEGFWKSLDTQKDKNEFNQIIKKGRKPWIR